MLDERYRYRFAGALMACTLAAAWPTQAQNARTDWSGSFTAPVRDFVWEADPQIVRDGVVTLLATSGNQRVRVFSNGVEVGSALCAPQGNGAVTPGDQRTAKGVVTIANGQGEQSRLSWVGSADASGQTTVQSLAGACARIPTEFSSALAAVVTRNAFLVGTKAADVAVQAIPPAPGAASQTASSLAALDAIGELSLPRPESRGTANVLVLFSIADRKALVVKGGVVEATLRIAVRNPSQPFGHAVFQALEGAAPNGSQRWLAISTHGGPQDDLATLLTRIEFLEPQHARKELAVLTIGSALAFSDQPAEWVRPNAHRQILPTSSEQATETRKRQERTVGPVQRASQPRTPARRAPTLVPERMPDKP